MLQLVQASLRRLSLDRDLDGSGRSVQPDLMSLHSFTSRVVVSRIHQGNTEQPCGPCLGRSGSERAYVLRPLESRVTSTFTFCAVELAQVAVEQAGLGSGTQLGQGPGLQLAYALSGDPEHAGELWQGVRTALAQAEAQGKDGAFTRAETAQRARNIGVDEVFDDLLKGDGGSVIAHQISQAPVAGSDPGVK
jgi:hypothetical protein